MFVSPRQFISNYFAESYTGLKKRAASLSGKLLNSRHKWQEVTTAPEVEQLPATLVAKLDPRLISARQTRIQSEQTEEQEIFYRALAEATNLSRQLPPSFRGNHDELFSITTRVCSGEVLNGQTNTQKLRDILERVNDSTNTEVFSGDSSLHFQRGCINRSFLSLHLKGLQKRLRTIESLLYKYSETAEGNLALLQGDLLASAKSFKDEAKSGNKVTVFNNLYHGSLSVFWQTKDSPLIDLDPIPNNSETFKYLADTNSANIISDFENLLKRAYFEARNNFSFLGENLFVIPSIVIQGNVPGIARAGSHRGLKLDEKTVGSMLTLIKKGSKEDINCVEATLKNILIHELTHQYRRPVEINNLSLEEEDLIYMLETPAHITEILFSEFTPEIEAEYFEDVKISAPHRGGEISSNPYERARESALKIVYKKLVEAGYEPSDYKLSTLRPIVEDLRSSYFGRITLEDIARFAVCSTPQKIKSCAAKVKPLEPKTVESTWLGNHGISYILDPTIEDDIEVIKTTLNSVGNSSIAIMMNSSRFSQEDIVNHLQGGGSNNTLRKAIQEAILISASEHLSPVDETIYFNNESMPVCISIQEYIAKLALKKANAKLESGNFTDENFNSVPNTIENCISSGNYEEAVGTAIDSGVITSLVELRGFIKEYELNVLNEGTTQNSFVINAA